MVTYYNKKDLVAFGNYLLSETRKNRIIDNPMTNSGNLDMRLAQASHADIENWKHEMVNKNKNKHEIDQ